MEQYKNVGGDSNIQAFECGADGITIQFKSGASRFYLYTHDRPGADHVENMKALAIAGQGLNSYIGKNLRSPNSFVRKW